MTEYKNVILTGDNVEIMRGMDEGCIDLTVTSPPYDGLRTYKGYSFDFENVAKELYRITKDGGVVVWIVNDATIKGSESLTSFKQAIYFNKIGFNVHDTMIYRKKNPMPSKSNRYQPCFEYMFVLSKGKPKTFNALLEATKNAGIPNRMNKRSIDGELTEGDGKRKPIKSEKRRENIWNYGVGYGVTTTDKYAFEHPAMFPESLVNDHILSWSNPSDIVFDPFGGSGTTAKMAKLNSRSYIHVDISKEYNNIARQRIADLDGKAATE